MMNEFIKMCRNKKKKQRKSETMQKKKDEKLPYYHLIQQWKKNVEGKNEN